jgi:hypothetical protein
VVRKKIRFIGMILVLLFGVVWIGSNGRRAVTAVADDTPVKELELEGYLITAHSANEQGDPSKISKECIRMPECAASGYGISVRQVDGKFQFFKFDENGQKLAGEILVKTTKINGITVIAKGILAGNILKITSLVEKGIQKPVIVELTGWLIDRCCSGTKDPASHTTECLRMESCAATGFGLLEKQKDGSFKFYQFDDKGHNLAVRYLKKVVQKDNVTIIVKGSWDGNILKVATLAEQK